MNTAIADPGAEEILSDPSASTWLKNSLKDALERDPLVALNDALVLAGVLEERVRQVFDLHDPT